jgi:hypothetical protein
MNAIMLVGLGVGLAAICGCVAAAPGGTPLAEMNSVGTPTPLAPPTASTDGPPAPLTAAYRSGRQPGLYPTPPITIDNSYHPSWTVDVYGLR